MNGKSLIKVSDLKILQGSKMVGPDQEMLFIILNLREAVLRIVVLVVEWTTVLI